MDWVYSPQGRWSGESRMERGGRAFQSHFWYTAWLSHSLWSLSLSLFLFSPVFFPVLSPSHTDTMSFNPIQSDILHYMHTLTNRCRALNDWAKNKHPGETRVMFNDLLDIHTPCLYPESFLMSQRLRIETKQSAITSENEFQWRY